MHPIDYFQWRPGWVPVPPDEFARQHDALLAQERWIIDGWGPWDAIKARFEQADTIIVVDLSLWVHYWWSIKRQAMCLFRPRSDGPPGCPMLPMTWPLLKMIWQIHRTQRPIVLDLVATMNDHARVLHLRSPRQLRQFIRDYC